MLVESRTVLQVVGRTGFLVEMYIVGQAVIRFVARAVEQVARPTNVILHEFLSAHPHAEGE